MSPTPASRSNPTTWDEYERRASPPGTPTSSVLAEEQALLDDDDVEHGTHHRRLSVTTRLAAVADIGGVNSIRSFAQSWQRAVDFAEVIPRQPSFVYTHAHDRANSNQTESSSAIQYGRSHVEQSFPQTGLLRQHLQASPPENAIAESSDSLDVPGRLVSAEDFRDRERKAFDAEIGAALPASPSGRTSIFAIPPHLAAPPVVESYGSFRSMYGTIGEGTLRARTSSGHHSTSDIWQQGSEEDSEEDTAHGEHQPIMVKEVMQGDKVVLTVEGQSTLPQSIFNSINAIIGVGLLSLPLAFKLSGWLFGLIILTLTASVTTHTSNLLARCMKHDPSLITYSDLAYISFGTKARVIVSALFTLELVAACVALVILFAESLFLLLPGVTSMNAWKIICGILVLVLNAMPLRWLSFTSVIGIFSTFCVVVIVIIDGLVKTKAPGSLWEPATTYLLPNNWLSLPLAYGLLASPWGAHSVFPSIYRDMRHPHKWGTAVKVTFSFSYVLDTCLAIIGVLMFGDEIREAITSNVLESEGYPKVLKITMCIFISIIPLTKIPLNARPLITTADVIFNVHPNVHIPDGSRSTKLDKFIRSIIRLSVVLVLLVISILFPAFDSVCAFLGAALCTLISIVLPISFYLKLFGQNVAFKEKLMLWIILIVFSLLGLVGTIWTFLPRSIIGAE